MERTATTFWRTSTRRPTSIELSKERICVMSNPLVTGAVVRVAGAVAGVGAGWGPGAGCGWFLVGFTERAGQHVVERAQRSELLRGP